MKHLILTLALVAGFAAPALAQVAGDDMKRGSGEAPVKEDAILMPKDAYQRIQTRLSERGVVLAAKGVSTADDLRKFQRENGLKDSGKLDVATLDKLGFSMIVAVSPKVDGAYLLLDHQQKDTQLPAGFPSGTPVVGGGKDTVGVAFLGNGAIRKIYRRLMSEGFLDKNLLEKGAILIDPKVSLEFVDALKKFQQARGIQTGGILGMQTLAAFEVDLDIVVADPATGTGTEVK